MICCPVLTAFDENIPYDFKSNLMTPIFKTSIVSFVAVIFGLSLLSAPRTASAQSDLTAFEKAISEDVVAVISVDLKKSSPREIIQLAERVGLVPKKEGDSLRKNLPAIKGAVSALTDAGVERISILFRPSDIRSYLPLWVASIEAGGDIDAATDALRGLLSPLPPQAKQVLQAKDGLVFGGATQAEIDSLFVESDRGDRDLSELIEMMHQHTVGIIIFGNHETRRVIREMLPDLPKPFNEATRDLIADHTDWVGLFSNSPPTAELKLIFQASDNESAQTLSRLSTATIEYALRKLPPAFNEQLGETVRSKLVPEAH